MPRQLTKNDNLNFSHYIIKNSIPKQRSINQKQKLMCYLGEKGLANYLASIIEIATQRPTTS